jgi:hypothetical protein
MKYRIFDISVKQSERCPRASTWKNASNPLNIVKLHKHIRTFAIPSAGLYRYGQRLKASPHERLIYEATIVKTAINA